VPDIDYGQIAGEKARKVERVLDVRQGELCWVVGTVYMDLPMKPNILDDVAKDVSYTWGGKIIR
jgi:DNA polymerase delta subunit 2